MENFIFFCAVVDITCKMSPLILLNLNNTKAVSEKLRAGLVKIYSKDTTQFEKCISSNENRTVISDVILESFNFEQI